MEAIRTMRGRGDSFGRIARHLNEAGIPTAQGGAKWYPATVRKILDNHGAGVDEQQEQLAVEL